MKRRTIGASESSSIYLFGVCAVSLVSLFLSLIFSKVDASFDGMSVFSWVAYPLLQLAFFATVVIYAKARHIDEIHVARIRKYTNIKQIYLIPLIGIATILVFLPLANLWTEFLNLIGYDGGGVSMPAYSNVGVYFLSLFVMALLPAFCEELFMRGNVFSGLSTKSVWFGILMSALFFSLMHANPYQTVHQFGLGLVLAIVMILSNSLFACVLLHFFNNFVSITMTAYMPFVNEWYIKLGAYNWLVGIASVVVGLLLLVILLYLFYRFGAKDERRLSSAIEYDDYTIYASVADDQRQEGIGKGLIMFFKSLFTKRGWQNITITLAQKNGVQIIGKNQRMFGVWLALALVCVYWLYNFIYGLI